MTNFLFEILLLVSCANSSNIHKGNYPVILFSDVSIRQTISIKEKQFVSGKERSGIKLISLTNNKTLGANYMLILPC